MSCLQAYGAGRVDSLALIFQRTVAFLASHCVGLTLLVLALPTLLQAAGEDPDLCQRVGSFSRALLLGIWLDVANRYGSVIPTTSYNPSNCDLHRHREKRHSFLHLKAWPLVYSFVIALVCHDLFALWAHCFPWLNMLIEAQGIGKEHGLWAFRDGFRQFKRRYQKPLLIVQANK